VNFSHIPKFGNFNLLRFSEQKRRACQGMVRMDYELTGSVPFIGASWTSSIATWLTPPLWRFCLAVTEIELAPLLGDGLVDDIWLGCDRGLGHTWAQWPFSLQLKRLRWLDHSRCSKLPTASARSGCQQWKSKDCWCAWSLGAAELHSFVQLDGAFARITTGQ
jgi:hypothetical protein